MAALLGLAAVLSIAVPAGAQGTLTTAGFPATMTASTAVAGQDLTFVTESSTTWGFVTVGSSRPKVVARLSSPLPAGVELRVSLAAPSGGAQSSGFVLLTTSDQDVVTNLPRNTTLLGLTITYRLSAAVSAGTVPLSSRAVTFTLIN